MAQVSIQSGVRVRDGAFEISHPVNLHHKLKDTGVSKGELVSTRGALSLGTGPGIDRGGFNWNGVLYRAMGASFVRVAADGGVTTLGSIANDGLPVRFTAGFDRMAIASARLLYYYDGTTLVQVTDPDLGPVLDVAWIAGYFATTDGTDIVVTELNDPTSVDPLKYGSAELDPDGITGVFILNEDLAAVGRYTIQFFRNVGGLGFPFQNITGATIQQGAISAQAKCRIGDTLAFVGGGRDEPIGVYLVNQGTALRVSDEDIDRLLAECIDQTQIILEGRKFGDEQHLILHAGKVSAGLAMRATTEANALLWHRLTTDGGAYRPRNAVYCYDQYNVGDVASAQLGVLRKDLTAHFGTEAGWQVDAGLLYGDNDGPTLAFRVMLREVELTGQFPVGKSTPFFSMTRDGRTWSREISRPLTGNPRERLIWRPNTDCGPLVGFRFRGYGRYAFARCDATVEPLS